MGLPMTAITQAPPCGRTGAAESRRECAGKRGADDAGRKDVAGVGRSEGDGALGDERQAHDVVHDAGVAICLGPLVLEEGRGEGDGQGGTMPPTMTDAMTSWPEVVPAVRAPVPKT